VTEWDGPSHKTRKTEAPCHSRCGTIEILSCSKALSAELRPEFCSPSPVMVASPYTAYSRYIEIQGTNLFISI
jgi:hypothetical protein